MPDPSGTVKSLAELLKRSAEASFEAFKSTEVWWRGHSRAEWPLVPGVHREDRGPKYEANISRRFLLKAHTRHSHCPPEDDLTAWLFLMQHYRLPTRLLDWTESPLIAAFFAASENETEDGAIWALDPYALNASEIKHSVVLTASGNPARGFFEAAFEQTALKESRTAAVLGREVDVRMLIQQSAFTIHGTASPIEASRNADKFLRKFIVPADSKRAIAQQLSSLGIKLHTLFPDLEHLAQELATYREAPDEAAST